MSFQNLKTLDLNLLIILNELLIKKNVSHAALSLNLTQSAVSHALNRLRHYFDDPLFVRDGKVMQPTSFALNVAKDLSLILHQADNLLGSKSEFTPLTSQESFVIGIPEYLAISIIPNLYTQFSKIAPNIRFTTFNTNLGNASETLLMGKADLVIGNIKAPPKSLKIENIHIEDYVCCVGSKNTLFKKDKISTKDYFAQEHLNISLSGKTKSIVDTHLSKTSAKSRTIKTTLSNYMLAFQMLEQHDFMITEPRQSVLSSMNKRKVKFFELPFKSPEFNISQLWHQSKDQNPAHQWLRQQIKNIVHEF